MQSIISPVTKAVLVALFIFAILLILYVILWPPRRPARGPRPPPVTFTTDRTERGLRRDAATLVALDSSVPPVFQVEEKMPHREAVRTHEPVSAVPRGGGRGSMLAPTPSIHPPRGAGAPIPAPPAWPRASRVSVRLALARSDSSRGGDPVAQRGRPREGSPLIPGLTRPEAKQLQIAPSP
ncbi:hypothetical protein R6Z07F_019638 [Ovis aries]